MTDLTLSQFASKDDLLAAQAARIAELESQLEAIGAGGVEPMRKPAAPQAVQAAVPVAWRLTNTAFRKPRFEYHDTKESAEQRQADFNRSVDDGGLHNLTPLYAAPAHPADGVPQSITDEREAFVNWLHGTYPKSYSIIQAADLWFHKHVAALAWKARAAIAATHPTQQGMEQPIKWPKARDVGRFGDMSPDGSIRVGLDADNDVYVSICDGTSVADIEFCTPGGGGGRSSRTRMALIALMCAIEADNASHPAFDFWQRNLAAQAKQGEQANG
ncbi:hypothetical protein [Comamonas jiangduensis]|uniref:hypothetical protein n=1 Tax=Comamonas jiangduensis TaxID=1194168 RepID=UPI0024E111E5|nr:hypothetical protein [Comamonas jiangduensis]